MVRNNIPYARGGGKEKQPQRRDQRFFSFLLTYPNCKMKVSGLILAASSIGKKKSKTQKKKTFFRVSIVSLKENVDFSSECCFTLELKLLFVLNCCKWPMNMFIDLYLLFDNFFSI